MVGIVAGGEVWIFSPGSLKHLLPLERKVRFVFVGPPRECINPIKTEHVIDAENVEYASYARDAAFPPRESVIAHGGPAINRNSPVLSPLLREGVIFKIGFRRRATR